MKNILLTGSTGFIGSHLLESLLEKGFNVFILTRKGHASDRINIILNRNKNRVKNYKIDNNNEIEGIFRKNKIDYILHLATTYKKTHNSEDIYEMLYTNISFGAYLCDLCIKYGIKYFINTGTFFEYEHKMRFKNVLSENSKEKAYNLYASTKIAFNQILRFYTDNYDLKVITLRLFSPYGPKDNDKIIPLLIKSIITKTELNLSGGKQCLSFTYVDDIVNAYLLAIKYITKTKNKFDIFNIGSSSPISLKKIYKYLKEISGQEGKNIKLGALPYSPNDIFYSECNNSKAKEILGRLPKYSIKEGLNLTYKYYKNEIH